MQLALALARQGLGRVEPNPMVGCVLVRDGVEIASGFHAAFGGAHAERAAVEKAIHLGNAESLKGATAYVSLEPCCHFGKTPPCSDLLLQVGIGRVVIAMQDPFSAVAGKGIAQLRAAGVEVEVGLEKGAAEHLNAAYLKRLSSSRPWVIAKWAMSLDGKIATHTGDSRWISSEASRAQVHRLRSRVDAILVGIGTARTDDPLLNARLPDGESPLRVALRVVVDSRAALSPHSQLARTAAQYPTLIWAGPHASTQNISQLQGVGCRVEICQHDDANQRLDELLKYLAGQYAATNLLVEGGGQILGSLLELGQIDQCEVYVAPRIIGGASAVSPIGGKGLGLISESPHLKNCSVELCDGDTHISCRL
jgi:diaminohydroxyphosphoribosylaminopyrimidine deaminase / 5-amino-6-(5-phosphoribosylamino)uracil reductase